MSKTDTLQPALFKTSPNSCLATLMKPLLEPDCTEKSPEQITPLLPPDGVSILQYPHLAQLRTFVDPFSSCKKFFSSYQRIQSEEVIEEFRNWRGNRYLFIQGREVDHTYMGNNMPQKSVLVGMVINGPVNGPNESVTDQVPCEVQLFQLSPEHRVYGFEKACITLDPRLYVRIGMTSPDSYDWKPETEAKGLTRLSFMEDLNECVFEHACSPMQAPEMRWMPFGKRAMGMQRIRVVTWEVWGFENSPIGPEK